MLDSVRWGLGCEPESPILGENGTVVCDTDAMSDGSFLSAISAADPCNSASQEFEYIYDCLQDDGVFEECLDDENFEYILDAVAPVGCARDASENLELDYHLPELSHSQNSVYDRTVTTCVATIAASASLQGCSADQSEASSMLPMWVCCLLSLLFLQSFSYAVFCTEAMVIFPLQSKSKVSVNTKTHYFWPLMLMFNINLRLLRRGVVAGHGLFALQDVCCMQVLEGE